MTTSTFPELGMGTTALDICRRNVDDHLHFGKEKGHAPPPELDIDEIWLASSNVEEQRMSTITTTLPIYRRDMDDHLHLKSRTGGDHNS